MVDAAGVGQSEVEIAGLADTTIVLLAPGMGDGIQAAKAGILEIGDVFVVNKADRDGADATVRDLRHMISLGEAGGTGAWRPPVVKTVASAGEGIEELVEALDRHHAWASSTPSPWPHGGPGWRASVRVRPSPSSRPRSSTGRPIPTLRRTS